MIEQGFNDTDSTIKEMTDFFETRAENWEPKEEKKKSAAAAKKFKTKNLLRKGKGKILTPVLQSPTKIYLCSIVQSRNTASYMGNVVILQKLCAMANKHKQIK